jgi:hypothetical protein
VGIRWDFVFLDGGEFDCHIEQCGNCIAFPHPMAVEELLNVLILVNLYRTVVAIFDFNGKELSCNSQILHLKSFTQPTFDCGHVDFILSHNKKVVNIEGDVEALSFVVFVDPDAGIRLGLFEFEIDKNFGNEVEPLRGDSFKLYSAFFRRQTWSSLPGATNPSGCLT